MPIVIKKFKEAMEAGDMVDVPYSDVPDVIARCRVPQMAELQGLLRSAPKPGRDARQWLRKYLARIVVGVNGIVQPDGACEPLGVCLDFIADEIPSFADEISQALLDRRKELLAGDGYVLDGKDGESPEKN